MNDNVDNVIGTIQKLLNMTTENGCNDNEAIIALQKAQALMAKHNIEVSQIESSNRDEDDIITVECEHKWDAGFRYNLAHVIADNHRCRTYIQNYWVGYTKKRMIAFMGVREDAQIAKASFEFAYKFIQRRGNQEYEIWRQKHPTISGKNVFNSYALGFIRGLREVLEAQSVALMIVTPKTVNDAYKEFSEGMTTSSAGMRCEEYYTKIAEKGEKDAKDHFGRKALVSAN